MSRTFNLGFVKNLKIWMKLAVGFGIILLLTTAVGYVGWSGLSEDDGDSRARPTMPTV